MRCASYDPGCRQVGLLGLEAIESPTSPVATGIFVESSDRGEIGHSHLAEAERRPTVVGLPRFTRVRAPFPRS